MGASLRQESVIVVAQGNRVCQPAVRESSRLAARSCTPPFPTHAILCQILVIMRDDIGMGNIGAYHMTRITSFPHFTA